MTTTPLADCVKAPVISIVIPTYNQADFLKEALGTVVGQTYPSWEAIVINNFSNDLTREVVEELNDPRIRLIDYANNGVIAASRNLGISLAQGKYVAFLDSDDLWHATKLERCVEAMSARGVEWICHGEQWFGNGLDKNVLYGPSSRSSFEALLYRGNCISTSAVVVKRSLLTQVGGFRERADIVTSEDYDLWLRLTQCGTTITFIDEILGAYRIHSSGQSQTALRNMLATEAVVNLFWAEIPVTTIYEKGRRRVRRSRLLYEGARMLQNNHVHHQAWPLFLKSFLLWPFDKRLLPAIILNALRVRF